MNTTTATAIVPSAPAKIKKFTNDQWDLIKPTLTEQQIADFTARGMVPSREAFGADRLSEEARRKILMDLIGEPTDEVKELTVNIVKVLDAGFPQSAASAPYWSGLAGGSMVAWSLGWTCSLRAVRVNGKGNKPGDHFRLDLVLKAAVKEDIEPRKTMWEKRWPKAQFPYPPALEPVVGEDTKDNGEAEHEVSKDDQEETEGSEE